MTFSGKTTTLYAVVNELKTGKVNIITVEDPVEYDLPGISQLQVTEARVLNLGVQDFLTKPVPAQSLQARFKAVLRRARKTRGVRWPES